MVISNPIGSDIIIIKGPAMVRIRKYQLIVKVLLEKDKEEEYRFPIAGIKEIILVGSNITISTGALHKLTKQKIPVLLVSKLTTSLLVSPIHTSLPNVRNAQHKYIEDPYKRVELAKKFIESKILGMISVARYLAKIYKKPISEDLNNVYEEFTYRLQTTPTIEELRNLEAKYSKVLWRIYSRNFIPSSYEFNGRNPRSIDPINQSLNYLYAIIYRHCFLSLVVAGIDPYIGVMHVEKYGRTPLVYDVSEMFKPVAIRSLIISANRIKLSISKNGLLTRKTIEIITKKLYRTLKSGNPPIILSIYKSGWNLRKSFLENTPFKPFIYVATK